MPTVIDAASLTLANLENLLLDCGHDVTLFGQGLARSLTEFFSEIKDKKAALSLSDDGSVHRSLGVVALLVERTNEDGEKLILLETHEELPNGRQRVKNALPNMKVPPPFANDIMMACELLKTELGIDSSQVNVIPGKAYETESARESSSYPGIKSEYLARYVVAEVDGINTAPQFTTHESKGTTHNWVWLSKTEWQRGVNKYGVYHSQGRDHQTTGDIEQMCMELRGFRLLDSKQREEQLKSLLRDIENSDVNKQSFIDHDITGILSIRLALATTKAKIPDRSSPSSFEEQEQDEAVETDLVLTALSGLSLHAACKQAIQEDTELMHQLKQLVESPDLAGQHPKINSSATSLLAYLTDSLATSRTMTKGATLSVDCETDSDDSLDKRKHVMVSYAWSLRDEVYQIAEELQQEFDLWIDVNNMNGSTLDAMAGAIDDAKVIVIVMTSAYKCSVNCKLEAEYAHLKQVQLIPVLIEPGYRPDGWLGMLLGSKLYFDFTRSFDENGHRSDSFDENIVRLKQEIALYMPCKPLKQAEDGGGSSTLAHPVTPTALTRQATLSLHCSNLERKRSFSADLQQIPAESSAMVLEQGGGRELSPSKIGMAMHSWQEEKQDIERDGAREESRKHSELLDPLKDRVGQRASATAARVAGICGAARVAAVAADVARLRSPPPPAPAPLALAAAHASEAAVVDAHSSRRKTRQSILEWSEQEVAAWLEKKLHLPQYCAAFKRAQVDGVVLCMLNAETLSRELGVVQTLHRQKILGHVHLQKSREKVGMDVDVSGVVVGSTGEEVFRGLSGLATSVDAVLESGEARNTSAVDRKASQYFPCGGDETRSVSPAASPIHWQAQVEASRVAELKKEEALVARQRALEARDRAGKAREEAEEARSLADEEQQERRQVQAEACWVAEVKKEEAVVARQRADEARERATSAGREADEARHLADEERSRREGAMIATASPHAAPPAITSTSLQHQPTVADQSVWRCRWYPSTNLIYVFYNGVGLPPCRDVLNDVSVYFRSRSQGAPNGACTSSNWVTKVVSGLCVDPSQPEPSQNRGRLLYALVFVRPGFASESSRGGICCIPSRVPVDLPGATTQSPVVRELVATIEGFFGLSTF
jgi:hypothetical protein